MHVNYLLWSVARTGGIVSFMEIGKRLVRNGHRVTATSFPDDLVEVEKGVFKPGWERDSPIEFMPLRAGPKFLERAAMLALSKFSGRSRRFDMETRRIAELAGGIPDADVNVATYFPTAFSLFMSGKGTHRFYHMQHYEPLFFDRQDPDGLLMSRLAEMSYTLPLNRIANSSWLKGMVKKNHGADSILVTHAIRNEVFRPLPDVPKAPKKRVISLGRLDLPLKGVGDLVEAMKILRPNHPEVELLLYGSEARPRFDIPVRYEYKPSSEKLAELYRSSHVVACPSWYESFPAPPLEGMSCGVPVVTTPLGVEDYARDGENCLIVPPRDPAAMANAISRVLGEEGLRERLVRGGLETSKRFSWDITAEKVEAVFLNAMKGAGTAAPGIPQG